MSIHTPYPSEKLVRVAIPLESNAWHGSSVETIWANHIDGSLYRVENSPYFAFGLSYRDVIEAEKIDEGQILQFAGVRQHSGASTYRLLINLPFDDNHLVKLWDQLQILGCAYEESLVLELPMWAVDVPPETDVRRVYSVLQQGEGSRVWEFEEGHCGHIL
ncbi:MAG: DUF4265 domain-containing protein [Filomicrobium sp.]